MQPNFEKKFNFKLFDQTDWMYSLKYQRSTTSDCRDLAIRKLERAKSQFLCVQLFVWEIIYFT